MKKIFMLLVCTHVLFGMEHAGVSPEPVIVDYDAGESLASGVTSAVIFGATPRISRFHQFTNLVISGLKKALEAKRKEPCVNLKRHKRQALQDMKEEFECNPHSDIALASFFAHGFDKTRFARNMKELVQEAQKSLCNNLVHVFLPNYFTEDDFRGMALEDQRAFLKRFLLASAQLYKQLYNEQNPQMNVHIVIPPLDDFLNKIFCQKSLVEHEKKVGHIAHILHECFFSKGISKAMLLNQDEKQLDAVRKKLGILNNSPKGISSQALGTIGHFTPYTMTRQLDQISEKYNIVSKDLMKTFEQLQGKR